MEVSRSGYYQYIKTGIKMKIDCDFDYFAVRSLDGFMVKPGAAMVLAGYRETALAGTSCRPLSCAQPDEKSWRLCQAP